jgi:hypothetical protein
MHLYGGGEKAAILIRADRNRPGQALTAEIKNGRRFTASVADHC